MPKNLGVWETLKVMDGHTGRGMGIAKQGRYPWRVLLVAGMWFQDLFNYDFRRTEMCIIPYGTQLGEISFCAYNTGAGWRKIVEEMYQSATLAEWYKEKGRHPVYAHGKRVPLPAFTPAAAAVDAARLRAFAARRAPGCRPLRASRSDAPELQRRVGEIASALSAPRRRRA